MTTEGTHYFITERNTSTGLKFQALEHRINVATTAQKDFGNKYNFKIYRPSHISVWGGISACVFENAPDEKIWKKVNNSEDEWMPRLNVKAGKEIQKEIDNLPLVSMEELNECIGFDSEDWTFMTHIGFAYNDEYFGFSINDKWNIIVPEDCEEVTLTKYKNLFDGLR
jgi:hypothetical protein